MDHSKKMFLINHETLQKLQALSDSDPKKLSLLDNEMQTVLKSKLNDHEKWTKYQQVLQRFLHFSNSVREPVKIPLIETREENQQHEPFKTERVPLENILETIPKNSKKKANLLLEQVTKNNVINWDKNGFVFVNGKIIEGSNIIDIINDISRTRKPINKKHTEIFLDGLKQINIPLEYIGNDKYRDYYYKDVTVASTSQLENSNNVSELENTAVENTVIHKKHTSTPHFTPNTPELNNSNISPITTKPKKRKFNKSLPELYWDSY